MGNFKVYTTFNKSLGQTAPSAWKCLKTQFWGPLTNWKFEPSPKNHTHTLTPQSINTQNRSKNYVLIYHDMHWTRWYRSKTLYHTEMQGFGHHGFQIKFKAHPPKLAEVEPSFRRSAYSLQNCVWFSSLTSGLESFGHKSTRSHRPWFEACCPKF